MIFGLSAFGMGITNVDPIKYNLIFERFLNKERVSMPDFDVDFDPEGREEVIEYVRGKYGENTVAKIITFGTMAAKNAVKILGGSNFEISTEFLPEGDERCFAVTKKISQTPTKYPRNSGKISKNPL